MGTLGGSRVGVCSTGIGGPSAEIAVVELQRLGASVLIRVGGTAALRHQLPLGTVCTVTRAVRWGGAARPYSPAAAQATPDRELLARLRHEGRDLGIELADVEVVSTDSYYLGQGRLLPGLEGPASREWTALLAQDVDALDMESETVLTVGCAVGARAASVLVVHANRCDGRVARGLRGPAAQDVEARRSHGCGGVASATTTRSPVVLTETSPLVSSTPSVRSAPNLHARPETEAMLGGHETPRCLSRCQTPRALGGLAAPDGRARRQNRRSAHVPAPGGTAGRGLLIRRFWVRVPGGYNARPWSACLTGAFVVVGTDTRRGGLELSKVPPPQ